MTTTALWAQADSYRTIADRAKAQQIRFSFNPTGYHLWRDIERAALRLRREVIDRANAEAR